MFRILDIVPHKTATGLFLVGISAIVNGVLLFVAPDSLNSGEIGKTILEFSYGASTALVGSGVVMKVVRNDSTRPDETTNLK